MSDVFCPKPDPAHFVNEGRDVLGEALAGEQPRYDSNEAQEAERRKRALEFWGAAHPDAPEKPRYIPQLANDAPVETINKAVKHFFLQNPDLVPHEPALCDELNNISAENNACDRSTAIREAVLRICKSAGLPINQPKPPLNIRLVQNATDERDPQALQAEVARLTAERRKVAAEVGGIGDGSMRRALAETNPRAKARGR